jgi:hypothetical protein
MFGKRSGHDMKDSTALTERIGLKSPFENPTPHRIREHWPTFRYLSDCDPKKSTAAPASPLSRKASAGIPMPQS